MRVQPVDGAIGVLDLLLRMLPVLVEVVLLVVVLHWIV